MGKGSVEVEKLAEQELLKIQTSLEAWRASNGAAASDKEGLGVGATPKAQTKDSITSEKPTGQSSNKTAGTPQKKRKVKDEKWETAASALDGGEQRQSKFMRLLGAGSKTPAVSKVDTSGTKAEIKRREKELEKQFEMGIQQKDGGARRKGLGA